MYSKCHNVNNVTVLVHFLSQCKHRDDFFLFLSQEENFVTVFFVLTEHKQTIWFTIHVVIIETDGV